MSISIDRSIPGEEVLLVEISLFEHARVILDFRTIVRIESRVRLDVHPAKQVVYRCLTLEELFKHLELARVLSYERVLIDGVKVDLGQISHAVLHVECESGVAR